MVDTKSGAQNVPQQLATPTDLPQEVVAKITEAVNPLVAYAIALYVKTKNFHWHLSGARFRDIHLLLDEQAEAIFETIDPLAERVRRIGGTTVRSISHINGSQIIEDNNEEFVYPDDMLRILMEDNKHIAKNQRDAHAICDENHDAATAGLLEDVFDGIALLDAVMGYSWLRCPNAWSTVPLPLRWHQAL